MSDEAKDLLCNRALSFLGEPTAAPFAGNGTSIRDAQCRAHYEAARDEVLTHHRWDFATALFPLAILDPQPATVPAHFPKAYELPEDMLRFHEVRLSTGYILEHFTLMGSYLFAESATLEGNIIYTTSTIEPEAMSAIARECVTYALAIRIGESLTNDPSKVEQMRGHLAQAFQRAITTDSRQTGSNENMDPLTLARRCGTYRARYYGFSR